MCKTPEPSRITITVHRCLVEEVYTTLSTHIEVDVLDFDGAGQTSPKEGADMKTYLNKVKREQQKIY